MRTDRKENSKRKIDQNENENSAPNLKNEEKLKCNKIQKTKKKENYKSYQCFGIKIVEFFATNEYFRANREQFSDNHSEEQH